MNPFCTVIRETNRVHLEKHGMIWHTALCEKISIFLRPVVTILDIEVTASPFSRLVISLRLVLLGRWPTIAPILPEKNRFLVVMSIVLIEISSLLFPVFMPIQLRSFPLFIRL